MLDVVGFLSSMYNLVLGHNSSQHICTTNTVEKRNPREGTKRGPAGFLEEDRRVEIGAYLNSSGKSYPIRNDKNALPTKDIFTYFLRHNCIRKQRRIVVGFKIILMVGTQRMQVSLTVVLLIFVRKDRSLETKQK
jgi:hypothetical protein